MRTDPENIATLSDLCRDHLRLHLLTIDRHLNLFNRIPQHGLPASVTSYLLYDVSVEEEKDEDDDHEKDNLTNSPYSTVSVDQMESDIQCDDQNQSDDDFSSSFSDDDD